ncbi:MAG TPA: hypothetical protein VH008_19690, partial [Pseudonocardia sp.]|nr:hypothetical protein [Pseudonocardia sp.]
MPSPETSAVPSALIKVLGPTEAEVDGHPADLGGPLARRLLTALVAAQCTTVSDDQLGEILWDAGRPPQAIAALRAYA